MLVHPASPPSGVWAETKRIQTQQSSFHTCLGMCLGSSGLGKDSQSGSDWALPCANVGSWSHGLEQQESEGSSGQRLIYLGHKACGQTPSQGRKSSWSAFEFIQIAQSPARDSCWWTELRHLPSENPKCYLTLRTWDKRRRGHEGKTVRDRTWSISLKNKDISWGWQHSRAGLEWSWGEEESEHTVPLAIWSPQRCWTSLPWDS